MLLLLSRHAGNEEHSFRGFQTDSTRPVVSTPPADVPVSCTTTCFCNWRSKHQIFCSIAGNVRKQRISLPKDDDFMENGRI